MTGAEEPKGRAKGGVARANALSQEKRSEIARKGAQARTELAMLPRATHGSADHPLKIGDIEIPCYVLEGGTRVLTQEGFLESIGRAKKAKGGTGAAGGVDRLPSFLAAKNLNQLITEEITESTTPIAFRTPGGTKAFGYRAEALPQVCNIYLRARDAGLLLPSQEHIAIKADILVRGLAETGIVALVDEATGYQKDRAKNALAQILEAFVAKELQPWVKTFPADYYEHLFRLRGLPYPPANTRYKPQYFGTLTNDIVYRRIAPGILDEIKRQNEKDDKKGRLHQRLTPDKGHPMLREHLASVVTIMKLSRDYADFIEKLNQIHARFGDSLSLDLAAEDIG